MHGCDLVRHLTAFAPNAAVKANQISRDPRGLGTEAKPCEGLHMHYAIVQTNCVL